MTLIIMENVDESLRGECTRFLLEVKAGIFLGTISAKVRELIWNTIKERVDEGGAILVFSYPNEQGFVMDMWGDPKRVVSDFEGLRLITNRA